MKQIILHIGYNKTGTTAVQTAFSRNASLLEEYGILYPSKCKGKRKSPAHHALAESLLVQKGKPLPYYVKPKIYSIYPEDHYWKLLHKELEKSNFKKCFISSEAFCRLRGLPEQMEFIKKQLKNYKVKILVYLRSQPEYFASAYNQAVKNGNETRTVDELFVSGWLTLDYKNEIDQWAKIFGKENLIIRIYDSTMLISGDIVHDVLDAIGLSHSSIYWRFRWYHKMWNIKLPVNMVETKRYINSVFTKPRVIDHLINFFLYIIGTYRKEKELLTKEQTEFIRNHFKDSNKLLGDKYLSGKSPFKAY